MEFLFHLSLPISFFISRRNRITFDWIGGYKKDGIPISKNKKRENAT
jgi:hypothetical protein